MKSTKTRNRVGINLLLQVINLLHQSNCGGGYKNIFIITDHFQGDSKSTFTQRGWGLLNNKQKQRRRGGANSQTFVLKTINNR